MRNVSRFLFLAAAFLVGSAVCTGQSPSKARVLMNKNAQWSFNFGGRWDIPFGFSLSENRNAAFIYGHRHNPGNVRGAITKFSLLGNQEWTLVDSSETNAGNATLAPNEESVVWTTYGSSQTQNALLVTSVDGDSTFRKELPSDATSINLVSSCCLGMVVGLEGSSRNPRVLFLDSAGNVRGSFVYAEEARPTVSGLIRGDSLWIQAVYGGGYHSFVALYDLKTWEQRWRKNFLNHIRIRFDVDTRGYVYVGGSRQGLSGSPDYRMYYTFHILDPNGNTVKEREWLVRKEGSYEANLNNWISFTAFNRLGNAVAIGGIAQRDSANTGRSVAYLAILSADSGEMLLETQWLYNPSTIGNKVNDGRFTSDGRLILVGNVFTSESVENVGYLGIYTFITTGVEQVPDQVPEAFQLRQNYPNPFNPQTTIEFEIPERSFVKLTIVNLLGQELETLVSEELSAGVHRTIWDATRFPSGTYLYRIETGKLHAVKRMLLVK